MRKDKILVIGANGQIGSVLTQALRRSFGEDNVVASDIRDSENHPGLFETINVLDAQRIAEVVDRYHITQVYHLAAILSAKGEANPLKTWDINMSGLFNVLEVAREKRMAKVFFPSSIAVFGNDVPRYGTPQNAHLSPSTVYGMSKVAGELWSQYYFQRYGLDVRSVRYPGVVGYQSDPGGGTTDYAVEIYHYAVQEKPYQCFLKNNTPLPMIYMDDAIRGTLELMDASSDKVSVRTSYNLAGMSFTPEEITNSIRSFYPDFKVLYQPDFRQQIADSWPASIEDSQARQDWNWQPKYDLDAMTADMILHLKEKYAVSSLT
ncbi:MAG: NAD-dependent epimerase/dehydratase family protein [Lewinellaceae bacterium]|nr:NAD-dependent epimerase/dehydratase family protein [Saprospiraceae bacterium]MCB9339292.1 NAD-dependent epimerase/dehydratase family protein [Lewinellaceae bacterium]